jgi:hypothetical protein
MRFLEKKTWATAVGLALAATTLGGVALAVEDPSTWYDGDNATVPDPNQSAVALKLYNASGDVITSGSTTTPIAAFAAADGDVRANDEYASLFVHLPQTTGTPGVWPGVQVTGTDKYSGAGAVTAPAPLAGKPFVRTTAAGYTLADVQAALPQTDTDPGYVGVYQLRLRTSSATAGVSDAYASTYLKITGTTWTVTTAPTLGGGGGPQPAVNTTVSATWPSSITYGTATSVSVTVTPTSGSAKPTGTVRLANGATTVATANLSAAGTATLSVPKTALTPGAKTLKVVYPGATGTFNPSESATHNVTVGKATPGQPTFAVTKKPTPTAKGAATVTVPVPAGLVPATGALSLKIVKDGVTKTAKGTLKSGTATVKLPKLAKGKWKVTITYAGDTYFLSSVSKAFTLKVK